MIQLSRLKSIGLISFGLGGVVLSGCATTKSASTVSGEPRTVSEVLVRDSGSSMGSVRGGSEDGAAIVRRVNYAGLKVRGVTLEKSEFDYPIALNERVLYWVDYFTGRGRKHFTRYLERSEHFIPYIVPILKQNGMPEDLVYLAMIESGFNNHARSTAKAVGPWQFIPATGKRYGMMINWWVDERRDTHKSTLSAIGYLKDLYNMFQSWELAAAAYNAGENKIARAVRRYGTKDFWVIARQQFLRPETRDYVPKIMAAAMISKNRELFGFPASQLHSHAGEALAGDGEFVKVVEEREPKLPPEEGKLRDSVQALILAESESGDEYENGPIDPMEDDAVTTAANPLVMEDHYAGMVSSAPTLAKPVATPSVNRQGEVTGVQLTEFEVQSPADLLTIARAAGLSYQTVKALNPELLRWCTPPNVANFRLKLPTTVKDKFLAEYNRANYPRKVEFLSYQVRKNESVASIARHFGIRVDPITDLNGISPKKPLRKGLRILLPIPNDRSRSLATLEVRDPPEKKSRRLNRRKSKSRYQKVSYKEREKARNITKAATLSPDGS